MNSVTIISNFLLIAVVFLITWPDEGQGFVARDWSDLDENQLESLKDRYNELWAAANRGKRGQITYGDTTGRRLPTKVENYTDIRKTNSKRLSGEDANNFKSDDEAKAVYLSQGPVRHERSVDFKRSINDPSPIIILPSRL